MKALLLVLLTLAVFTPGAAFAKPTPKAPVVPSVVKRAVNAITAGDPKPLKSDLTPQMAQVLTRDVMRQTKKQYVAPLGAFVSVKVASTQKVQGMDVMIFVMHFKKGDLTGQMAVDTKGKVAGLYVRPGGK
jgi:hypothetical protein